MPKIKEGLSQITFSESPIMFVEYLEEGIGFHISIQDAKELYRVLGTAISRQELYKEAFARLQKDFA